MFEKPIMVIDSQKIYKILLLSVLLIIYILICAETDIFIPSFPEMINYFGLEENKVQLVLITNSVAMCFSSLIVGPISDVIGRRKTLLIGLLLLFIASIICALVSNFKVFLLSRFIQGAGASVPLIISTALIFESNDLEDTTKIFTFSNAAIAFFIALAPIFGGYMTMQYGWRVNFIFIAVLGGISLLIALLIVKETLPQTQRKEINFQETFLNYKKIIMHKHFILYNLIASFPMIVFMIYVSNISIIFINHLSISIINTSYYQASTIFTFIIFSLISTKIIELKGVNFIIKLGFVIIVIFTYIFYIFADYISNFATYITIIVNCITIGGAFIFPGYNSKILSIFPENLGASGAVCMVIRHFLTAILIMFSEYVFDGTIKPVALIIATYLTCILLFKLYIHYIDIIKSA